MFLYFSETGSDDSVNTPNPKSSPRKKSVLTKKKKTALPKKQNPKVEVDYELKVQPSTSTSDNIGKFLSEALILGSTNPQYDKRLLIDLPIQYMKTTSSEHVVYINCFECQNKNKLSCQSHFCFIL